MMWLTCPRSSFDGTVPTHFYGELVKTTEGRMILEAKGHFREFADYIRTNGMEDSDLELMDKLKSVLWAVVRLLFPPSERTYLEG